MKLGLDVRILSVSEQLTGVPSYVFRLAQYLIANRPEQSVLFSDRPSGLISSRVVHSLGRIPWQQSALPVAAMKMKIDVFHGPGYGLPIW